jgi:hypothetical protein
MAGSLRSYLFRKAKGTRNATTVAVLAKHPLPGTSTDYVDFAAKMPVLCQQENFAEVLQKCKNFA